MTDQSLTEYLNSLDALELTSLLMQIESMLDDLQRK